MEIIHILKQIGIETQTFIAGMSGALVLLIKTKNMTRTQQFLTVLSGGLSANYLTPIVAGWFNLHQEMLYGVAFLLGYSGMKSVEMLINIFYNKLKKEQENGRNN
jgi:hypothetical protein